MLRTRAWNLTEKQFEFVEEPTDRAALTLTDEGVLLLTLPQPPSMDAPVPDYVNLLTACSVMLSSPEGRERLRMIWQATAAKAEQKPRK